MTAARIGIMITPEPQPNFWIQFIGLILPWATISGLGVTAFRFIFKYFSEAQDENVRKIVREELSGEIQKLSTAIDELREAIWEMKR